MIDMRARMLPRTFRKKNKVDKWTYPCGKSHVNVMYQYQLKWAVFFFNVPCPIHWVNAYANASACLRGLQRVPTPKVFNTRCLRGCLRGVLCWMAMLVLWGIPQTVYCWGSSGNLRPSGLGVGWCGPSSDLKWRWLLLAPFIWGWVLVGVAAFLGRWSRRLRAASTEPTRAYAVEPRQIPRNHLSYSYKFICINKLVHNLHIPSHLKNATEHLPTRLAYAEKFYIASARAYACLRGL